MERFYSIPTKDVHGKKVAGEALQNRKIPRRYSFIGSGFSWWCPFQVTCLWNLFFAFCGKILCYTPNTVFMVCSIKDRIACWLSPCLLVNAQIVDEQWLKGHHICGKWLFLHLTEGISHTHPLLVHGNAAHYKILCSLFGIQSYHRVFTISAGTSA